MLVRVMTWILVTFLQTGQAQTDVCGSTKVVNSLFSQLSDCRSDFLYENDTRVHSDSVMDCARLCSESDACQAFNYLSGTQGSPNCGMVQVKVTSCSKLKYFADAKHYQKASQKPSSWTMVLSQRNNTVIEGSATCLKKMIQQGSQVRVLIDREGYQGQEHALELYSADAAWIEDGIAVANIFTFKWFKDSDDSDNILPVWTKLQVTTKGWVHQISYNEMYDDFQASLRWFVQDSTYSHSSSIVLELDASGTVLQGGTTNVIAALEQGFPLQLVEMRNNMNNMNTVRSFPVSNANIYPISSLFYLYGYWVKSPFSPYTTGTNYPSFESEQATFENDPTFHLKSYTGLDIMDSRALPTIRYESFETVSLVVDTTWEKVFEVDQAGNVLYGTQSVLTERILSGADIRVGYQCVASTKTEYIGINSLLIDERSVVTGFSSVKISPVVTQGFNWRNAVITSTGSVKIMIVKHSDGQNYTRLCKARITWFADKAQREIVWSYQGEPSTESNTPHFPEDCLYNGLMPRVVYMKNESGIVHIQAHSIHRITNTSPLLGFSDEDYLVLAFNYRSFNGSALAINAFGSFNSLAQMKFDLVSNPVTVEESFTTFPSWLRFYA